MTTRQPDPAPGAEPERGFVLAAPPKGVDPVLGELRELARTAGVEPVAELVQHRERHDPRTYVGKGKLEELKEAFKRSGAESLIVDDELSPVQQRALEDALQARVVDRTQLILDIFAQHAVSAEGKLQVELAQLEVLPEATHARQVVLQLRELDLELSLGRDGVLRENVEDQLCPVDDAGRQRVLERALLRRRQFLVGDQHLGARVRV